MSTCNRHFASGELSADQPVFAQFGSAEGGEEQGARKVFQQFALLAEMDERAPAEFAE